MSILQELIDSLVPIQEICQVVLDRTNKMLDTRDEKNRAMAKRMLDQMDFLLQQQTSILDEIKKLMKATR